VQWAVTRGEADLNPSTSTTGADGRAAIATPRSVGEITIRASVHARSGGVHRQRVDESRIARAVRRRAGRTRARILREQTAELQWRVPRALRSLRRRPHARARALLRPHSLARSKVASEVVSAVTAGVAARLSAVRNGVDRFSISSSR
jgi:hypothetical protein